jgi:hypothetical protein
LASSSSVAELLPSHATAAGAFALGVAWVLLSQVTAAGVLASSGAALQSLVEQAYALGIVASTSNAERVKTFFMRNLLIGNYRLTLR